MKIGLSRKVISVILAVLMVFTALPMTVFASVDNVDGTDEKSAALQEAITAYENKMDGTVYTNMYAAYKAYVDANEAYDAYVYGDDSSIDLATYTNALTTATANMTAWSSDFYAQATGSVSWPGSSDSSTYTQGTAYDQVLYATEVTTKITETTQFNNCLVRFYYPATTVLLYDGISGHVPKLPVGFTARKYTTSARYIYAVYPCVSSSDYTDDTNLQFTDYWHSGNGNNGDAVDWGWAYARTNSTPGYNYATGAASSGTSESHKSTGLANNSNNWYGHANVLSYVGGDIDGAGKELKLNWYTCCAASSTGTVTVDDNVRVKIVNYKLVIDTIETSSNTAKIFVDLALYKEGGMATLLAAYDAATSFDPQSYFTSGDGYTNCINQLNSVVNNLNNAVSTPDVTTDTEGNSYGYASLRTAITDTRATYNSTASDKYTAESWGNFTAAYEAARDTMANLLTTGYNDASNAQAQADALNAAYAALEVDFTPADTSELIKVIDDAEVVVSNNSYFTEESYTAGNFAANIAAAKIAVWGSEDAYKDAASTIDSDYQSVVDEWETTIGEAIMALQISKDAAVASAKGYSMNSAIEYAATFNSADYSNYSAVTQAIVNCNNFAVSIALKEPGAVAAKIAEYRELVAALISAINTLQPAFSKLSNGTVANAGTTDTTTVSYYKSNTAAADYSSSLTWERPNYVVLFRTTHPAGTFDIGTSNFTWYHYVSAYTSYDQYLETLNFAALNTLTTGELSAGSAYSGTISDYAGGLGVSSANSGNYAWNNFKVTGFTGNNGSSYTGKDLNGTGYMLSDNHDFSNDLLTCNNDIDNPSGICVHDGSTYFTANGTITVPKTTEKTLTLATIPTSTVYTVNPYLGYLQYYKYNTLAATTYRGFAYAQAQYTQTTTVIDIAYLIDLINTVDALNYLDYTAASWADVETALAAAKADMDYGNMSVEDITAECVTRYTNLWNAWKALDAPLSNQVIKDAVADYLATYNETNKSGKYSPESWAAFETAYKAAYDSVYSGGQYTDLNIRNVDATDENTAAIAKVAQDVIDAYNALVLMADFSGLIAAASTAIDNYAYTVADLQSLADVIDSSAYLKYTAEQKAVTYEDQQSAIDAETNTILAAISALTAKEPIDTAALEAAKNQISIDAEDPDAWDGIAEAKEYIDNIAADENLYSPVTIYGATVYGINYTQDDTDVVVTEALSMLTPQYYTVTVIDQDGNTKSESYIYGTFINVTSIDGSKVDWYYSYKSNTAENSEKYYTTDTNINFVVKGDTILRTTKASDTIGKVKVTYVSSISNDSGKVIAVDYVESGSTVSQLPVQPTVPYYTATGYTLNGAAFTASTVVTENVTVVANYEADTSSPVYTITWAYLDDDLMPVESVETYEYNDEVTLTFDEADYWIQFYSEDAYNSWINLDENVGELEYVVFYGNTYTFRAHEDVYIAAERASDIEYDIESGYIDADSLNVCSVRVTEDLVYADDKFSIIGTYTMPNDCTLVEAGILYAKGQGYDLTLKNVDNTTIYRLKSSQHTAGNQFVISIKSANIPDGQLMQYASYLIYKDANGESHTIISNPVNVSYQA